MDCIHARLVMTLHNRDPRELDATARAALEQHLEQCADCLAWSHQESRVDETLGHAIQNVPVPAALPSRILHHLEQRAPRRRLRWAAAAAVLLLSLSAGGYLWFTDRPEVQFADVTDELAGLVAHNSPESAEAWFADHHSVTIVAPRQFNYDLLNSCGLAKLKGRSVPRLEFFHRGTGDSAAAVAHVYVIDQDRFDVQELVESVPSPRPTHNHVVEVLRFGDHPGFIYIAVFTGGNLRPTFLAHAEG